MVSGLWSNAGVMTSVGDVDTCLLRVFQKPPFLSSGLSPVNHPETDTIPDALAGVGWGQIPPESSPEYIQNVDTRNIGPNSQGDLLSPSTLNRSGSGCLV